MSPSKPNRVIPAGLSAVILLLIALPVPAQTPAQAPPGKVVALWADGVDQIVSGRFGEARESLALILKSRPSDENYKEIASWLDRRDRENGSRQELHNQQRDIYVRKAKRTIAKDELAEALIWTREAMECTTDEAGFMGEPWVQALHDSAVAKAKEHKKNGEWLDASRLYYGLDIVFKGNAEYARELKECLAHSRLEALYGEDSRWQDRLEGIIPHIVSDALWQIHRKYVEDANFQALGQQAVDRLRLLAESAALANRFPAINEPDKNKQYLSRLNRLSRKIGRQNDATYASLEDLFDKVLLINQQTFDLPRELVIYEFLEGALGSEEVLDEFTSMIWPSDFAEFEKHTQGHFSGVGIQIMLENSELTVVSPLEDTPAFRAGIQAGDKITHVDGASTEGMALTSAVQTITGPVGSEVVLTIHRPTAERTFDVTLRRQKIQIHSVKGHSRRPNSEAWEYLIDRDFKIGYLRITNFQENTALDLRQALDELDRMEARGLILDLRFNPGGLLRSAIEVSELFLPRNARIVSTEGLHSEAFSRDSQASHPSPLPMVVLVNDSSASASEIVSGALKDHGRAIIVGERSFGKGSVQNLIPVGNTKAHLKLTTAHYYLPGGRCIHKRPDSDSWGVEPDIVVPLVPDERSTILRMRRDADVIQGAANDVPPGVVIKKLEPQPAPKSAPADPAATPETAAPQEASKGAGPPAATVDGTPVPADLEAPEIDEQIDYPDIDYQLDTALLVMRVKLLGKLGFDILPKVRLGDNTQPETKKPAGV